VNLKGAANLEIIIVSFNATTQLMIRCEYNDAIHQLFIDFKNAYDSVRRDVLTKNSDRGWSNQTTSMV
jgi:hypothetical protein